jgi:hypothetical protein
VRDRKGRALLRIRQTLTVEDAAGLGGAWMMAEALNEGGDR